MFAILAGPDLIRALLGWIFWGDLIYQMSPPAFPNWYGILERLRLFNYWIAQGPYEAENIVGQSFLVCGATAAVVLLVAFWLFNRRAY